MRQTTSCKRNPERACILAAASVSIAASIASAGGPAPFTDEAVARGLVYTTNHLIDGKGTAFADLDDDGDADVVILGDDSVLTGVFDNNGTGHFFDRSLTSGIGALSLSSGIAAGDYDGDGDLDLFITRFFAPDQLFRNDGGFTFTNVTAAAGVGNLERGTGPAWGDYDGDGRLDLFVPNYGAPNRLYHNNGNGTFTDVAADLGVDDGAHQSFQGTFFDYDRDGDSDLYLANDRGSSCLTLMTHNRLWENVGGTFVEVTDETGTEACVDAMTIAVGDFDNNGYQDLYCTNIPTGPSALMMNSGLGSFARTEDTAQVESNAFGWGGVFLDYDNDGWLDLYVCNILTSNRLYRHEGAWPCADVSAAVDADLGGFSFTVAAADVEGDGDLDLLVQNRDENIHLLINHEGEARNWARFDVLGEGDRRWAIGAGIDVRTGRTHRVREVIAGCNYKGQNELVQHVGLGATTVMDEVTVTWTGGTTRTITGLPANRRWTLIPPDRLGDGDRDGDRDLEDFLAFSSCAAAPFGPGCEPFDHDGDADVDAEDLSLFLAVHDGPLDDCNSNRQPDIEEIFLGAAPDLNRNGHIDMCEEGLGDLDGDGTVGATDLAILVGGWGPCAAGCPADLTADGSVGFADLTLLLMRWG